MSQPPQNFSDSWVKLMSHLGLTAPKNIAAKLSELMGETISELAVRKWMYKPRSVPSKVWLALGPVGLDQMSGRKIEPAGYVARGLVFNDRFSQLPESVQLRMLEMVDVDGGGGRRHSG
jgi:hypothetical protein